MDDGKAASFFFLCKITLLEYGEHTKHRGAGLKWHSIKGGDRSDRLQLAAKRMIVVRLSSFTRKEDDLCCPLSLRSN